jgi:hypothetical protein
VPLPTFPISPKLKWYGAFFFLLFTTGSALSVAYALLTGEVLIPWRKTTSVALRSQSPLEFYLALSVWATIAIFMGRMALHFLSRRTIKKHRRTPSAEINSWNLEFSRVDFFTEAPISRILLGSPQGRAILFLWAIYAIIVWCVNAFDLVTPSGLTPVQATLLCIALGCLLLGQLARDSVSFYPSVGRAYFYWLIGLFPLLVLM